MLSVDVIESSYGTSQVLFGMTLEVNAAEAGTLTEIAAAEGSEVEVGALLGIINAGGATIAAKAPPAVAKAPEPAPANTDHHSTGS